MCCATNELKTPRIDENEGKKSMKIVQMPPAPPSTPEIRHFRQVSLEDMMTLEIPQIDYILERLIPRSFVTILGGHGGTGKTIFGITTAAHVAAGVPWCGFQVKCGRVLFVTLEDPGDLVINRLKRIIHEYGLSLEMVERNMIILDGSHTTGALMDEVVERGVRHLQGTSLWNELVEASEGFDFIVIDNASDAFSGNENDRSQVKDFMGALTRLARKREAAILLLAHVDKTAARYEGRGNSYSGSTAWHNSARSRLALTAATGNDGLVELVQEKLNLGPKVKEKILLRWDDDVLRPHFVNVVDEAELDNQIVLAALNIAVSAGIIVPTATSGTLTAHGALKKFLPSNFKGKRGRRRLYDALKNLLDNGKIKKTEFVAPNRHTRIKYDLAQQQNSYDAPPTSPIPPRLELAQLALPVAALADSSKINEVAHWRQEEPGKE